MGRRYTIKFNAFCYFILLILLLTNTIFSQVEKVATRIEVEKYDIVDQITGDIKEIEVTAYLYQDFTFPKKMLPNNIIYVQWSTAGTETFTQNNICYAITADGSEDVKGRIKIRLRDSGDLSKKPPMPATNDRIILRFVFCGNSNELSDIKSCTGYEINPYSIKPCDNLIIGYTNNYNSKLVPQFKTIFARSNTKTVPIINTKRNRLLPIDNFFFCLTLALIFALLGSAMFATGRNPFAMLDITPPRFKVLRLTDQGIFHVNLSLSTYTSNVMKRFIDKQIDNVKIEKSSTKQGLNQTKVRIKSNVLRDLAKSIDEASPHQTIKAIITSVTQTWNSAYRMVKPRKKINVEVSKDKQVTIRLSPKRQERKRSKVQNDVFINLDRIHFKGEIYEIDGVYYVKTSQGEIQKLQLQGGNISIDTMGKVDIRLDRSKRIGYLYSEDNSFIVMNTEGGTMRLFVPQAKGNQIQLMVITDKEAVAKLGYQILLKHKELLNASDIQFEVKGKKYIARIENGVFIVRDSEGKIVDQNNREVYDEGKKAFLKEYDRLRDAYAGTLGSLGLSISLESAKKLGIQGLHDGEFVETKDNKKRGSLLEDYLKILGLSLLVYLNDRSLIGKMKTIGTAAGLFLTHHYSKEYEKSTESTTAKLTSKGMRSLTGIKYFDAVFLIGAAHYAPVIAGMNKIKEMLRISKKKRKSINKGSSDSFIDRLESMGKVIGSQNQSLTIAFLNEIGLMKIGFIRNSIAFISESIGKTIGKIFGIKEVEYLNFKDEAFSEQAMYILGFTFQYWMLYARYLELKDYFRDKDFDKMKPDEKRDNEKLYYEYLHLRSFYESPKMDKNYWRNLFRILLLIAILNEAKLDKNRKNLFWQSMRLLFDPEAGLARDTFNYIYSCMFFGQFIEKEVYTKEGLIYLQSQFLLNDELINKLQEIEELRKKSNRSEEEEKKLLSLLNELKNSLMVFNIYLKIDENDLNGSIDSVISGMNKVINNLVESSNVHGINIQKLDNTELNLSKIIEWITENKKVNSNSNESNLTAIIKYYQELFQYKAQMVTVIVNKPYIPIRISGIKDSQRTGVLPLDAIQFWITGYSEVIRSSYRDIETINNRINKLLEIQIKTENYKRNDLNILSDRLNKKINELLNEKDEEQRKKLLQEISDLTEQIIALIPKTELSKEILEKFNQLNELIIDAIENNKYENNRDRLTELRDSLITKFNDYISKKYYEDIKSMALSLLNELYPELGQINLELVDGRFILNGEDINKFIDRKIQENNKELLIRLLSLKFGLSMMPLFFSTDISRNQSFIKRVGNKLSEIDGIATLAFNQISMNNDYYGATISKVLTDYLKGAIDYSRAEVILKDSYGIYDIKGNKIGTRLLKDINVKTDGEIANYDLILLTNGQLAIRKKSGYNIEISDTIEIVNDNNQIIKITYDSSNDQQSIKIIIDNQPVEFAIINLNDFSIKINQQVHEKDRYEYSKYLGIALILARKKLEDRITLETMASRLSDIPLRSSLVVLTDFNIQLFLSAIQYQEDINKIEQIYLHNGTVYIRKKDESISTIENVSYGTEGSHVLITKNIQKEAIITADADTRKSVLEILQKKDEHEEVVIINDQQLRSYFKLEETQLIISVNGVLYLYDKTSKNIQEISNIRLKKDSDNKHFLEFTVKPSEIYQPMQSQVQISSKAIESSESQEIAKALNVTLESVKIIETDTALRRQLGLSESEILIAVNQSVYVYDNKTKRAVQIPHLSAEKSENNFIIKPVIKYETTTIPNLQQRLASVNQELFFKYDPEKKAYDILIFNPNSNQQILTLIDSVSAITNPEVVRTMINLNALNDIINNYHTVADNLYYLLGDQRNLDQIRLQNVLILARENRVLRMLEEAKGTIDNLDVFDRCEYLLGGLYVNLQQSVAGTSAKLPFHSEFLRRYSELNDYIMQELKGERQLFELLSTNIPGLNLTNFYINVDRAKDVIPELTRRTIEIQNRLIELAFAKRDDNAYKLPRETLLHMASDENFLYFLALSDNIDLGLLTELNSKAAAARVNTYLESAEELIQRCQQLEKDPEKKENLSKALERIRQLFAYYSNQLTNEDLTFEQRAQFAINIVKLGMILETSLSLRDSSSIILFSDESKLPNEFKIAIHEEETSIQKVDLRYLETIFENTENDSLFLFGIDVEKAKTMRRTVSTWLTNAQTLANDEDIAKAYLVYKVLTGFSEYDKASYFNPLQLKFLQFLNDLEGSGRLNQAIFSPQFNIILRTNDIDSIFGSLYYYAQATAQIDRETDRDKQAQQKAIISIPLDSKGQFIERKAFESVIPQGLNKDVNINIPLIVLASYGLPDKDIQRRIEQLSTIVSPPMKEQRDKETDDNQQDKKQEEGLTYYTLYKKVEEVAPVYANMLLAINPTLFTALLQKGTQSSSESATLSEKQKKTLERFNSELLKFAGFSEHSAFMQMIDNNYAEVAQYAKSVGGLGIEGLASIRMQDIETLRLIQQQQIPNLGRR